MGIYWKTIICYGFRRHNNPEFLRGRTNIVDKYNNDINTVPDSKGEFIIIPESLHTLKSIDPLIDSNDIKLGYVTITEINKALKLDPSFFNLNTDKFDKLFHNEIADKKEFGWFIVEYMFDSHNLPNIIYSFTKKLPIIKQ